MFSMVTVASSTRMPTASASPPRVMMLSVWPSADSRAMENRIASGMEITMTRVERQLPRNSRIIRLVRAAAMAPSLMTPDTAARTKMDWSASGSDLHDRRQGLFQARQQRFDSSTMSRVEADPLFSTVISTARWPSMRTSLR